MNPVNCLRTNTLIGTFTTADPIDYHRQDYETASWWREYRSDVGTFEVRLSEDYHRKTPIAYVELPATVTDEYFPSSFYGVQIGKTVKRDDVPGRRESFTHGLPLPRAIADKRFQIKHEWYEKAIAYSTKQIDWWVECLNSEWTRENGADKQDHHANLSMVAHYSGLIQDEARVLAVVKRGLESYNSWVQLFEESFVGWMLYKATEEELVEFYTKTNTPYGEGSRKGNAINNAAAWRGIEGVCWKSRGCWPLKTLGPTAP